MAMNNPEKYEKYNEFQKRDSKVVLEDYREKIGWKPNASVADLGCGDGLVNNTVLKPELPKDFKELIGFDISQIMVDYANAKYGDERTKFYVADLGKPIQDEYKGKFDHVYSSYALQFIADQETVCKNVYDLLKPGGNCIILMMGACPYRTPYYKLATEPRWQEKLKNIEKILTRLFLEKNWIENYRSMLQKIGFKDIVVEDKPTTFVHEKNNLRGMLESGNLFNLDTKAKSFTEFFDTFMEYLFKTDGVEKLTDNFETFKVTYSQVIVFAKK